MDRDDEMLCKLCLKELTGKNFQVIGEVILKALAFLPLNLSLDETENYMCDDCSEKLFAAFDFKVMCLDIEDSLVPYVDSENAPQVDLRDAYLKVKQATVTSDQEVCRLCMRIVDGEFKSLEELGDTSMVGQYIPEVNFSITKDPIVCTECWNSLGTHIEWLRKWIKMEKKIKIEAQDSDDYSCIKNEEIDLTLKEDHTDGKEKAKPEPDNISKILSQLGLNFKIPYYLTQLLLYNGYDTIQSLALFNDNDLKTIESFGKEVLPDLLNKDEMVKFYGIFIKKPSLFRVVGGHKKLLNFLIEACKSHCSKEKKKKKVAQNIEILSEGDPLQKRYTSSHESHSVSMKSGVSQNTETFSEGESLRNKPTSQESHSIDRKRGVSQNIETLSEGESLQKKPAYTQESHSISKKTEVSQNVETLSEGESLKEKVSQNIEILSGGESDVDTTSDESAAISHIKNLILNYQRKFLDTLQLFNATVATKKANALQNLQDIKIKIDTKYVIVTCTECGFRSRCCGQLDNGKKKWVLSNFNKHFKTHFKHIPKEANQYIADNKNCTIENLQNGRYVNDSCSLNDVTGIAMSTEIQRNASDVEIMDQASNNTSNSINSDVYGAYLAGNLSDFLAGRNVVQSLGISSSHCYTSDAPTNHEY